MLVRPPVELLAPARDLDCARAAVDHGADAVYIGAPSFGARQAAGNSLKDLEKVVAYARPYRVKTYITLNTLLTDAELPVAEKLIWQLYELGADALIIQDYGVLGLHLPPMALHASTQMDNRTAEKIKFLKKVGFSRAVLARELSIREMAAIHRECDLPLEAFVHGALCVSYSGKCYMSAAACGRSANRGACAQYCRLPYDLLDADGRVLIENKYLLSLPDMDRSEVLDQMIAAGITSFKIEGRLKEVEYVKNITAYYRQRMDVLLGTDLQGGEGIKRASSGVSRFFFTPDPQRTFHRGATAYFATSAANHVPGCGFYTPKSVGKCVGKVVAGAGRHVVLQADDPGNGDGLCALNVRSDLVGFRVNTCQRTGRGHWTLMLAQSLEFPLKEGSPVYRNSDNRFKQVLKGKTAERRMAVKLKLSVCSEPEEEAPFGVYVLEVTDEDGIAVRVSMPRSGVTAQDPHGVQRQVERTLKKWGNTLYEAIEIRWPSHPLDFIPVSAWTELRRAAAEAVDEARNRDYLNRRREEEREAAERLHSRAGAVLSLPDPENAVSYTSHCANGNTEAFYLSCGIAHPAPTYELRPLPGATLMICKYCIKRALGICPHGKRAVPVFVGVGLPAAWKGSLKEPLSIRHGQAVYPLAFDCVNCRMSVMAPL